MIHVCEYECVEVYVCVVSRKQRNVSVPLAVWCGRWWDDKSAETNANVIRCARISCKSFIKYIYNYFNINSKCNLNVPLLLFRQLRSKIINSHNSLYLRDGPVIGLLKRVEENRTIIQASFRNSTSKHERHKTLYIVNWEIAARRSLQQTISIHRHVNKHGMQVQRSENC